LIRANIRELQKLACDLEKASKQNKIEAFFNSDDDVSSLDNHNETLTNITTDLTVTQSDLCSFQGIMNSCLQAALAVATRQDTSQIRRDIAEAVKQLHVGNHSF
jgi:hypothetical protein